MLRGHRGQRGDHRAGRRDGYRQGRGGGVRPGAPTRPDPAGVQQEIAHMLHDDPRAAAAGRPARRVGRDPGGHGGHLGLLEAGVLPAGGAAGWTRGWSTPATSSTCRAGRRPTSWTRCGCARSPSGRCCGPASCRPRRIRQLRDLTRYRADLVKRAHRGEEPGGEAARGRPDQAVRGGLGHLRGLRAGDARRADRRGTSTRRCWRSWPATRMRAKIPLLEEAFTGQFTDHHAFLLRTDAGPHRRGRRRHRRARGPASRS